ncbi:hypothetical protein GY45DRAFT_1258082 [Cubamyces sp. BRFM 1775]|nr:hypothetical protein GY45DRAFT_1258082 [Cubamyces sp. BRFM 1775]
MGKSYGVIGQGDVDNEEDTDSSDRTAFSDVEFQNGEGGYAYPGVPAAYEFLDPEIPCVVPDAARLAMSPSEEQLLHHSMAHPWAVPPYNVTERPRRSARRSAWRSLEAAAGALAVSALLLPFGAGFMVIDVGSFGVGSFGLLMAADFAFRAGAASLNRRRVNKINKQSPIAKSYETYTTLPRMNRPKLPECSITVVGYREDEHAWESCLESLKGQQYPVKHIISVIDGNEPADMAMTRTFASAFPENERLVAPSRFSSFKAWLTGTPTAGHAIAHESALNYVLDYLYTKATIEKWANYRAVCFTQPHANKRHAMFTTFLVGSYALGTKDALLTTDSDTRLDPAAASNLMAMLFSEDNVAGVTGDVDVDRRESIFPNVYALNNWFTSNVDSPCQSFFGSVSRLSSPMAVYRISDLMDVVSPWIMQTHFGKDAAIGEDISLASQLLSRGLKTTHTYAAKAYTDAPNSYVRWIKQQARWSRAMYREAIYSSPRLNNLNPWLAVEATRQLYYPAVLVASVLYLLYTPAQWEHLVIWLTTIGGAVLLKTIYAVMVGRDVRLLLFPLNQLMFVLGVVPTKLWALLTTYINSWGTSARSAHEIARSESVWSRTLHIGYLLPWYTALSVGLAYYLATALSQPLLWIVSLAGLVLVAHAYVDVFRAKVNFFVFAPRLFQQGRTKVSDVEAFPAMQKMTLEKPKIDSDSSDEDSDNEQFEADMAAVPLRSMQKPMSFSGEQTDTVFEAPPSRKPSLMPAGMDRIASPSPHVAFSKPPVLNM